jgi:hypothetical protein
VFHEVAEQRGLPGAGLPTEHDGPTLTGANVGQELVKRLALRLPAKESNGAISQMEDPSNATLYLLWRFGAGAEVY